MFALSFRPLSDLFQTSFRPLSDLFQTSFLSSFLSSYYKSLLLDRQNLSSLDPSFSIKYTSYPPLICSSIRIYSYVSLFHIQPQSNGNVREWLVQESKPIISPLGARS